MDQTVLNFPSPALRFAVRHAAAVDYVLAEHDLSALISSPYLDQAHRPPELTARFEATLGRALVMAFRESPETDSARLFLQRVLYRINRLKLFWYDDLTAYDNEHSPYLREVREQIESAWEDWESTQRSRHTVRAGQAVQALIVRTQADLDPTPSEANLYFRHRADIAAYKRLLEMASLDALVEASQLSRTLGGASNPIHATLTRMLFEEYGGGRIERKHSTYFASMLEELGMFTWPEAYFYRVSWQVLAGINLSFMLSERKRYFLRYIGGLLYTEISTPSTFRHFQAAADRLGLHRDRTSYWQLHIQEDVRHGQWMLDEVAIALCERYPDNAWELVHGYDQQRHVATRAGESVFRAALGEAA